MLPSNKICVQKLPLDEAEREDLNKKGRDLGFADCPRCGDSFAWKPFHSTKFSKSSGCFPLCEECWLTLTAKERLPFYAGLVLGKWLSNLHNPLGISSAARNEIIEVDWPAVEAAVLSGK